MDIQLIVPVIFTVHWPKYERILPYDNTSDEAKELER